MEQPSSQNPGGVDAEQEVQGGFLFVPITGSKGQAQDQATRKRLRAHVMHNFRDKKAEKGQRKAPGGGGSAGQQTRNAPNNAGQKLRFRLGDHGQLEENIPMRHRQKKVDQPIDDENDVGMPTELARRKQQAVSNPDFEMWTKQYFGDQPDLEYDLQPNFQLPALLHTSEKQQYRTVTEGYHEQDASKGFWEDLETLPTTTALVQVPLPTSPLFPFGRARLDPLNVLPFQLSKRDEEFIEHFRSWETDSWCPVNGRGVWFAFALQNELLFHATMYHWGTHFMTTNADFLLKNPEITDHKLASIRMINQQLTINNGTVQDETIAAVAAIFNVEMSFGSRDEAKKHMNGLEMMVNMRGGIEKIKSSIDGVLQRLIGWNDLKFAELFGVELTFSKECSYLHENASLISDGPCFRQSIHGVDYGPLIWDKLQGDVINLLHEVRILCEEVNTKPFRALQEAEKIKRSDWLHRIERKLRNLTLIDQDDAIVESSSDRMWRATALAGLMYVHHMLRFMSISQRQFNFLSRDLQLAISLTSGSEKVWEHAPEILVWALTTGTIISEGRMEHGWYIERLASACREVGYTSWDIYREKMKSFLWVARLDDARYQKVWAQVEPLP